MSYCSNCKVELAQTETVCPLCKARINSDTMFGTYPSNTEKVPISIKHSAAMGFLSVFPAVQLTFGRLVLLVSEIKR